MCEVGIKGFCYFIEGVCNNCYYDNFEVLYGVLE